MQDQASSLDRHSDIQTLHYLTAGTKPRFQSLPINPTEPCWYQRRPFNSQTTPGILEAAKPRQACPHFAATGGAQQSLSDPLELHILISIPLSKQLSSPSRP